MRVLLAFVAGCSFHAGTVAGDAARGGDALDDGRADGTTNLGPWSTPQLVLAAMTDDDPTLTSDMLEMYFNRSGDIYVTRRLAIGDPWSLPARVDELSTGSTDTTPEITGDGLTIFLASNRSGSMSGSNDIWTSTRLTLGEPWPMPVHVDELATNGDDNASAVTDDGLAIVWNSGTPEDLYTSTRTTATGTWSTRTPVNINSSARDFAGVLSQDRLTLHFDSTRGGDEDLYVAKRTSPTGAFGAPMPITELNTTSVDGDPWVSPDGRHMFFSSNRSGTYAIYQTSR